MNTTVSIIIILFCIVMSAYFSATETAFSTLNKTRIKALADKGSKRAQKVLKIADDFDGMLSTILIGNNIVNILSASLATILFVHWIDDKSGPTVSTVVMTIVVLIFGEISPKSIAKEHPEQFAMFSSRLLGLFMIILKPINFVFRQWKKLLSLIFKTRKEESMTEEELMTIIKEAEQVGDLDKDEGQIIKSAIEFNDLEVGDILTPRMDVTAIDINMPVNEISKIFIETGYSRLPVYEGDFDVIIGVLYYKDFYIMHQTNTKEVKDILKPVIFATKNQKIHDLMKEFQNKQLHFAVIIDEFSSVLGIVTLEDIVEEIVGEIDDEYDEVEQSIVDLGQGEYLIDGSLNIDEVNDVCETSFDSEDFESIGGLVLGQCNGSPEINQEIIIDSVIFTIKEIDKNRIVLLHLKKGFENEDEKGEEKQS